MTYHKEGPACGRIPYDPASSEARPCQQSCRDGLRISAWRRIGSSSVDGISTGIRFHGLQDASWNATMIQGSKGILPPMIHGLLRISCSRNPKTPQIRSFFYEKWLLFGVLRVNKSCFFMQAWNAWPFDPCIIKYIKKRRFPLWRIRNYIYY